MNEHDVIELSTAIARTGFGEAPAEGEWPAGTVGTVVAPPKPDEPLLVEISDDDGVMLDLVDVPADEARVIAAA